MDLKRVAVIGAGDMGHRIAELFALNGYDVSLMDAFPEALEKAKEKIASSFDRMVQRGRITKEQADAAITRIGYTGEMARAVSQAGLVVEAVPESMDLKKSVLKEAAARAPPGAIIASNTSNFRISDLAESVPNPERVVGMHFFNPPTAMKAVEVIPGEKTDQATVDTTAEICTKLGKTPIKLLKDSPGFIANRVTAPEGLLFCLILDKGIATPPEVDAWGRGQGLPMGPYEDFDFVGIDVVWDSLSYYSRTLSPEYGKVVAIGKMVQEKRLGKKTGKGFYDWSTGRAAIPEAQPTDKVSIMDVFALEINEAVKLIEEGVAARADDIEKGVTLGWGRPFGPIAVAKDLSNAEVKSKLEELATKYDTKVFAPTKSIAEGRMRDALEGRLGAPAATAAPSKEAAVEKPKESAPVYLEKLGGGVARIVLNRPKFNTINSEMLEALDGIIDELSADAEARVVVVTGAGTVLSSGADLSQYFSSSVAFTEFMRKGQRLFRRLTELPKLTIAVMKGYALGGALELAVSCDLRIATEDVILGFPELTRGLVPGWSGTQRVAKLIGLSQASSLILTGERISGKRAFEIGLVHKLVTTGDADEFAVQYATELASAVAPVAVMLAKRLLNKGTEVPSDVGLEMEAMADGLLFGTDDVKEGVSAFLGKRKPQFKGK